VCVQCYVLVASFEICSTLLFVFVVLLLEFRFWLVLFVGFFCFILGRISVLCWFCLLLLLLLLLLFVVLVLG